MSEQLWCVHIEGLDDYIATDSEGSARQEAAVINAYLDSHGHEQRTAATRAVVMTWPFTPDGHARSLEEDWSDVQRMPHRQAAADRPESVLANLARRMKELIRAG
ncbi:hypothetical protein [Paraburkholderia sp. BCC1886]|uniref:hypothetical protein n=1 Tax=Paraburkholderia sp. BCC1886 TaxID=2562670 RepID=UPI001182A105|nr:hypothetical protein [Paraburkholderia sp. BCC1886]